MEARHLRVELGLNLKAGTLPRTNPNMRLFPLQNALIDLGITAGGDGGTGANETISRPAWYSRLRAGDRMSFRLVDITDLQAPRPPEPTPALVHFRFSEPATGQRSNPFDRPVFEWRLEEACRMRPSPAFSREGSPDLPTWDVLRRTGEGWCPEPLPLAPPEGDAGYRSFEFSVALEVHTGGWVNQYVFDPEMIVGDSDG